MKTLPLILCALLALIAAGCMTEEEDSEPKTSSSSQNTGNTASNGASKPGETSAKAPAGPSKEELEAAALEKAFTSAQQLLHSAIPSLPLSPKQLLGATRSAYEHNNEIAWSAALKITRAAKSTPSADLYAAHGEGLLKVGKQDLAREILVEAEVHYLLDPRLAPLIDRAIIEDPAFLPPPREIKANRDVYAIKYLGGGSTITMRFFKDKTTIGAFKPKQSRLQSDYKAEIAAWRLCRLIRCSFEIPYNEHIKILRRTFNGLYARLMKNAKQVRYKEENFQDLRFIRDKDGKQWLHGTLKAWIRNFTQLPIEHTKVWRGWVSLDQEFRLSDEELSLPAIDDYSWSHTRENKRDFRILTKNMGSTTRRELGSQISDVLVFDFLISNWDRFSTDRKFFGANCQFKNGKIVSIDNGAAFPRSTKDVVVKNLKRIQRFRPQTVKAIRELDPKVTQDRLFPDASKYEKERFEHFWLQRAAFLEYVDVLITEYGEEAVLSF